MKHEDVDDVLNRMDLPHPENMKHQQELRIPLLNYRKSSKAGLWLLVLPGIYGLAAVLKYDLWISSPLVDAIPRFFAAVERHPVLTYLIPVIFLGLPLLAMTLNFLAIFHFSRSSEKRELVITAKIRPLNIAVFLFSFAVLAYFMLPDRFSF